MGHRNIFGPVLALEVPLEVALVVEGVVAMRTLVELLLMSCNVPFEQRLARPLFRALRAFKEGFFFICASLWGRLPQHFFLHQRQVHRQLHRQLQLSGDRPEAAPTSSINHRKSRLYQSCLIQD